MPPQPHPPFPANALPLLHQPGLPYPMLLSLPPLQAEQFTAKPGQTHRLSLLTRAGRIVSLPLVFESWPVGSHTGHSLTVLELNVDAILGLEWPFSPLALRETKPSLQKKAWGRYTARKTRNQDPQRDSEVDTTIAILY